MVESGGDVTLTLSSLNPLKGKAFPNEKSLFFIHSSAKLCQTSITKMASNKIIEVIDISDDEELIPIIEIEDISDHEDESEVESEDEILPLSEDEGHCSDYVSEQQSCYETLPPRLAAAMTGETRVCVIQGFYLDSTGYMVCMECYIRSPDAYGDVQRSFVHDIGPYNTLTDLWCRNCDCSLSAFIPPNVCGICIPQT